MCYSFRKDVSLTQKEYHMASVPESPAGLDHSKLIPNQSHERAKQAIDAPQLANESASPKKYKSTSDRHPWHNGQRKKTLDHRLKRLSERNCTRHSKAVLDCPDCGEFTVMMEKRFDGKEELDASRARQKAYFEKWRTQSKMKDRITAYLRPDEKTQILLACEALDLSQRDFIVSSCLEASKFVLELKKGDKRKHVLRDEDRTVGNRPDRK
tara:strand:- start:994 stop:1626 length:633 start_codon:yes stop_codon:yes gene_type:complete